MRRALLVDLYALDEYDLSLALGCLKAYADADAGVHAAWTIDLLHLPERTPADEVAARVMGAGADLVGFSCYSWNIRKVERSLAKLPDKGRPFVVMGGIEVTPIPAKTLQANRNADIVVFGEGEETFREILQRLAGGTDRPAAGALRDVPGVAWRDGRQVRVNAARPMITDLDTIPSPFLAGTYGDALKGQDRVMVETARGCPYTCTFCFEPRGFAKVRSFSVERAQRELEHIVRSGVREILYLDTNFNMDRKRAIRLWEFLAKLPGRARHAFELRGELLDADQARALSRLDYYAEIGLQSVNAASLRAVKRWHEPERFSAGITALLEAGIYRPCSYSAHGGVGVDLMMGLPHETVADVHASLDFVFALAPSSISMSMTKILPGTDLFDDAPQFKYEFDPDALYEARSSSTMSRADAVEMLRLRDAVDFAYNRVHAVRTIAFVARGLGVAPSAVFADLARRIAESRTPLAQVSVQDLSDMLAELCRARGDAKLGERAGGKLTSESLLNVLQKVREAKRVWWANALFAVGYRFLRWFGGLPPLPAPIPAPRPREGLPVVAARA